MHRLNWFIVFVLDFLDEDNISFYRKLQLSKYLRIQIILEVNCYW